MIYMLDTNAVSDILRERYNVRQRMEAEINSGNAIAICPIVYYEIICGFKISNASKKLEQFMAIFQYLHKLAFDESAMIKAAEISLKYNLDDNDVYKAATAIVNGCTLVTANDKHFSRIEGLKVENWR